MTRDNYSLILILSIFCAFCMSTVGHFYGRFVEQKEAIKAGVACWYTDGNNKSVKFQYCNLKN